MDHTVSIIQDKHLKYPASSPFSPSKEYPEYSFKDVSISENPVYDYAREMFYQLGMDEKNFGTSQWNPFGSFIKPGNKVVIKPNWVRDFNQIDPDISGLVTHPSILRVIIDYCLIALKNQGEIVFGDAPIQLTDFEALTNKLGIRQLLEFYKGKTSVGIVLKDFRREIKTYDKSGSIKEHIWRQEKDFIEIDLAEKSFLHPVSHQYKKFRVTSYDPKKMLYFHNPKQNKYVIEKEILEADVVIQIPKFKTHRKAGITGCLKNSVGINCQKDALVHHRKGSSMQGGDAYPDFNILKTINENLYEWREKTTNKTLQRLFARTIGINTGILRRMGVNNLFEGSWYGNNTLWRTILDITNILFYYDSSGQQHQEPARKVFYFVDAVVGGDMEGPLEPRNVHAGFMVAGWNPVLMDIASATLVGFDYQKITTLKKSLENKMFGLSDEELNNTSIIFNSSKLPPGKLPIVLPYLPSKGWKGHIEKLT